MPSALIGGFSGGDLILSGNYFSGRRGPVGGIQLRWAGYASGNAYVGLSGGVTITSGGNFGQSGGLDGMLMQPGDAYWVPNLGLGPSGTMNIYVAADSTTSGQGRIWYEVFGWITPWITPLLAVAAGVCSVVC